MELQNIFTNILDDYYKTCKVEQIPMDIMIVEDIGKAYAELRPDHAEREPNLIEKQRGYNGTTVPPKDYNGKFSILLSREYLRNLDEYSMDWVGTVVHEATHVNDFVDFSRMVGVNNFDIILVPQNYRMFHLWTEFHAKAVGYFFIRKYTFVDVKDEKQAKYIIETELPYQIKVMTDIYTSTDDGSVQMYYIVHFMGRLYVWQKLFPKHFSDRLIKEIFTNNVWMYELYNYFKNHDTLKKAYEDFDTMKAILKKNFPGLD